MSKAIDALKFRRRLYAHDAVLLVKRLTGTRFQAIRNPRPDLL